LNPLENEHNRCASSTHSGGMPDEKSDKTLDRKSDKKPESAAETTPKKQA